MRIPARLLVIGLCLVFTAGCEAGGESNANASDDDSIEGEPGVDVSEDRALLLSQPSTGLSLHPMFASHMVLQRDDQQLAILGWAPAGAKISVQFDHDAPVLATAQGAQGAWRAPLGSLPPGGPHTLVVSSGGKSISLSDIMVGDVWLISGQSNSTRTFDNLTDPTHYSQGWRDLANNEIKNRCKTMDPSIRMLRTKLASSTKPLAVLPVGMAWQGCTPESIAHTSAEGIILAIDLHKKLNVPIGIVQNGYGGTTIRSWLPGLSGGAGKLPASSTYNALVAPLSGVRFKAVSWLQGESDSTTSLDAYQHSLTSLLATWRSTLGQPKLPFLIVQIAAYDIHSDPTHMHGAEIRAAQARVATHDPLASLVVTLDLGDPAYIHPPNKWDVGHRSALAAEALVYGKANADNLTAVVSSAVRQSDGSVHLGFHGLGNGLMVAVKHGINAPQRQAGSAQVEALELEIANTGWLPATGVLIDNGTAVRVTLAGAHQTPIAVRYNMKNSPSPFGRLYGKNNLPVGPFFHAVAAH